MSIQSRVRRPGFAQGLTLVMLAWVSTIAAVVLAPVLPEITRTFSDDPFVAVKIPLVATGPSLLVALLAIPWGMWSDRMGRRSILLAALLGYGVAGTAPLWLPGLDSIVVSRLALGLAEAAIMTIGTALISDYFEGIPRQRWFAAQTGTAPFVAVFLVAIGGLLGGFGWRTPFWIYAFGFVLVPLVLMFIWEPARRGSEEAAAGVAAPVVDWSGPVRIALVIVLGMVMFILPVVQFSFLVNERGMSQPEQIGLWSALVTLGNPLGSLVFAFTVLRTNTRLLVSWTLYALGFCVMALLGTVPAAIVGGFIANLGAGFFLPTGISWLLSRMPPQVIGRASGLFTSSVFFGHFCGPLIIVGLTAATGSLSRAILVCGIVCAAAAFVALARLPHEAAAAP